MYRPQFESLYYEFANKSDSHHLALLVIEDMTTVEACNYLEQIIEHGSPYQDEYYRWACEEILVFMRGY